MELKITQIQNFCIHDGPGIRTTVFLAGCPLSCSWCHNPEARIAKPVLLYEEKKCTGCQSCLVCPNEVHSFEAVHRICRDKCTLCGRCVESCPEGALSKSVRVLSEDEYLDIVARQKRIVGDNGGITFSGGEPMAQGRILIEFLDKTSVHKAIETCGFADEEHFCEVISHCDYVMFDLKLADDEIHRKYTGVSNSLILKNLENLRRSGKPYILRTPLIPGITDTEENLSAIERIVSGDPWEKLPYNTLAPMKYERIGEAYPLSI